jgi:hypothetical protein
LLGRRDVRARVVREHVTAEERVAGQDLVGALAGEHDLESRVADPLAQQILGDAVGVHGGLFAMDDCIDEMLREHLLRHAEAVEVRAHERGHLLGDRAFVERSLFEGDGERLDRIVAKIGGDPENRARVQAAADVAAHGNVGAQPQPDRLAQLVAHDLDVLGLRARGRRRLDRRILQIPVAHDLHVIAAGEQIVAGRHLVDAVEQRTVAVHDRVQVLVDALVIPARGNSGGEQRLRLRGEVELVAVARVVERLDAEAVARREQQFVALVPEHEGELAAQMAQAVRAFFFVQVKDDLAVRARAQAMTAHDELALIALVVVKLAVDDDVERLVLVRDRLVAGRQVDDAEARVSEADALVRRDPLLLAIRPAMVQCVGGARENVGRDRTGARENGDDSAHEVAPFAISRYPRNER